MYDVIVAGAGPTGLAAGIQLPLFGLDTLILEANEEARARLSISLKT